MSELNLPLLDPETAPEPAGTTLRHVQKRLGFLPNLYRVLANSPIALDSYLAISNVVQNGTLSAAELNIVLLAASRANGCRYCVAAHSAVADMQKDDPKVTEAVRRGAPIDDRRLEALRRLTEALVTNRGHAEAEIRALLEAGYRPEQVLEVLVGIALKTLSNYTNHLTRPPLDKAFAGRQWAP